MSTTATPVSPQATEAKRNRHLMGHLTSPIKAVKVYRKKQSHVFAPDKPAVSWLIITPENKLVKATTYGGDLGKDFNLGNHNTRDIPPADTKTYRKTMRGYEEVTDQSEYPAFVAI